MRPGYIFVSREPYIIQTILGSCVSVYLFDKFLCFGGMNHYIYAKSLKGERNARYGDVSIPYLIKMMYEMDARRENMLAHVLGGARSTELKSSMIGMENQQIAKQILQDERIEIAGENTGGKTGLRVVFRNWTGEVSLSRLPERR